MQLLWILAFWTTLAAFLYAQVGYLVLLRFLARRKGRDEVPAADGPVWPSVTLIIPAHNEETVLNAKLENSLAIDYPAGRLAVSVASDGSTDRTVEIARAFEHCGVRVLAFQERRGKAALINDAIAQAKSDVVFLCDANVMFRPDALKQMVLCLADPHVGAVSGDVRLASHDSSFGAGESLYYRVERAIQSAESRLGSIMDVDGGMYIVRKELFQPLPVDTILDDSAITMQVIRSGKRVLYQPAAIATENATPSAIVEFWRRVRVTAGAVQLVRRGQWPQFSKLFEFWQFCSHRLLLWAGPVWLLILLLSSVALARESTVYRVALGGQLLMYLLAGLASLFLRFRNTRIGGITFYFVMSHVAMAVGLVMGLLNRQQAAWRRTSRIAVASGPATTTGS